MHLFITSFLLEGDQLTITEDRVVKHMGKVLRMKKGEMFMVQDLKYYDALKKGGQRYILSIESINKKKIKGKVIECKKNVKDLLNTVKVSLCVALPNTGSKLSLMAQKITEVGVDEIIFRKAERSQMKGLSIQKIEKLQKVALEASEQSQRWFIPSIKYKENIEDVLNKMKGQVIIFDIPHIESDGIEGDILIDKEKSSKIDKDIVYGIVGPEGGLSERDYKNIGNDYILESLGGTVLRMETAAIVAGWKMKNKK